MTNPTISSLRAARNWMDSLGMRSYGEVDLAIAKEVALGESSDRLVQSSAEPSSSAWQGVGFAAYASALLDKRSFLGNDLDRLMDRADQFGAGHRSGFGEMSKWCDVLQTVKDKVNSSALPVDDMQNANSGNTISEMDGNGIVRATIEVRLNPQSGNAPSISNLQDKKDKSNQVVNIRLWI